MHDLLRNILAVIMVLCFASEFIIGPLAAYNIVCAVSYYDGMLREPRIVTIAKSLLWFSAPFVVMAACAAGLDALK